MVEANDPIAVSNTKAVEAAVNVYNSVKEVFPDAVTDFESRWSAFEAACRSLPPSASPVDCTRTKEFETLKKQGQKILAVVAYKLATDVERRSYGAFVFNALINDSENCGLSDNKLNSEEARQRYVSHVLELCFQRYKGYERRVKVWKEHCDRNRVRLGRDVCCSGEEYWDLLEVGPGFLPLILVEYSRNRGGYWYELLHELVHGRTTEAMVMFNRCGWLNVWGAFLNGLEYKHVPKFIPTKFDIQVTTGKKGAEAREYIRRRYL